MIKALAFIYKKRNLSDADFRHYYESSHAPLATSLLTFEGYERNFINSNLNPLFDSLGSISIFKYKSMESLDIISEQMASDKGDILRKDELNFMDVPKNFYVLTKSNELTKKVFKKKIFSIANNVEDLNILDSYLGIEKISENALINSNKIINIEEYGIKEEISFDRLEKISQDHKKLVFASSVS